MDLQKERKAFDAYFRDKYPLLYKDVFDEDGDDRAIIGYSFAWQSWQAAKAQAVPDGFVVVHIDALARAAQNIRELNNGEYYSEEIEENVCTIEAMIEAQGE